MNDPLLVRRFERLGDLTGQCEHRRHGEGAALHARGERLALDEFHHERAGSVQVTSASR
jgi:hypothetical protein